MFVGGTLVPKMSFLVEKPIFAAYSVSQLLVDSIVTVATPFFAGFIRSFVVFWVGAGLARAPGLLWLPVPELSFSRLA